MITRKAEMHEYRMKPSVVSLGAQWCLVSSCASRCIDQAALQFSLKACMNMR